MLPGLIRILPAFTATLVSVNQALMTGLSIVGVCKNALGTSMCLCLFPISSALIYVHFYFTFAAFCFWLWAKMLFQLFKRRKMNTCFSPRFLQN